MVNSLLLIATLLVLRIVIWQLSIRELDAQKCEDVRKAAYSTARIVFALIGGCLAALVGNDILFDRSAINSVLALFALVYFPYLSFKKK